MHFLDYNIYQVHNSWILLLKYLCLFMTIYLLNYIWKWQTLIPHYEYDATQIMSLLQSINNIFFKRFTLRRACI